MRFKCDNCGDVDHVLVDGYHIGDRFLEGVLFEITITSKGSFESKVSDIDYFINSGLSVKKWEKLAMEYASEDCIDNGCCSMICPLCNDSEVITIVND
jgi:hypothetical protein